MFLDLRNKNDAEIGWSTVSKCSREVILYVRIDVKNISQIKKKNGRDWRLLKNTNIGQKKTDEKKILFSKESKYNLFGNDVRHYLR